MTGLREVASSQAGLAASTSRPLPHSAAVTENHQTRTAHLSRLFLAEENSVSEFVFILECEQRPEADIYHLPRPPPPL